jgi:hypothetical protein
MEKKKWSLGDKLTAGGLFLAVVAIIVGLLTPEVRQFFHLEKPAEVAPTTTSQTSPQPTPQIQSSEPPKQEPAKPPKPTKKTTQKTTTRVTGNNNVAGNTVEGNNNILGNNNTVNNYGPPAVQLVWAVSDAPAEAHAGEFAKALTVKSNALYTPVYLAITCDTDVEELRPIGASTGVRIGYFNDDKKQGFLRILNPPVTPESPLTVIIISKTPLKVLSLAMVKDKQP